MRNRNENAETLRQIGDLVSSQINVSWLYGYGKVATEVTSDPSLRGGTGASLYLAKATLEFVIKYHFKDVPDEIKGYEILATGPADFVKEHLVKPLLKGHGNPSILIIPYLTASPLHDIMSDRLASDDWIADYVYPDFLTAMRSLWKNSLKKSPPDLEKLYLDRIRNNLLRLKERWEIRDLEAYTVEVNGKCYGTLAQLIAGVRRTIQAQKKCLKSSCLTHGDEHAKNILIGLDGIEAAPTAWKIIDYVRAMEEGDWVFSIAKMLHWWRVYYALENAKGKTGNQFNAVLERKRKTKRILITYDRGRLFEEITPLCRTLDEKVVAFGSEVASNVFNEKQPVWQARLKAALFAVLFGSIHRHLEGKNKFAIPVMLGESVESLAN